MLGRQPVIDLDDPPADLGGEPASRVVMGLDRADDPSPAMDEHQCRSRLARVVDSRPHGPVWGRNHPVLDLDTADLMPPGNQDRVLVEPEPAACQVERTVIVGIALLAAYG